MGIIPGFNYATETDLVMDKEERSRQTGTQVHPATSKLPFYDEQPEFRYNEYPDEQSGCANNLWNFSDVMLLSHLELKQPSGLLTGTKVSTAPRPSS